jgi:uncharacterized integral membrane protein
MIRKTVVALVLVPLAVLIVVFAVANRQPVTVSFDPFGAGDPALSATVPLYILIFILVIMGVIVGGLAAWLRQHKWRRAARRASAETRALKAELAATRQSGASRSLVPPSPRIVSSQVARPPAA